MLARSIIRLSQRRVYVHIGLIEGSATCLFAVRFYLINFVCACALADEFGPNARCFVVRATKNVITGSTADVYIVCVRPAMAQVWKFGLSLRSPCCHASPPFLPC